MLQFIKNWTLPIAIVAGIIGYFLFAYLPVFNPLKPYAQPVVSVVQPVLIFSMLFLSFCKIDIRNIRFRLAHLWLILIQCVSFSLLGLSIYFFPQLPGHIIVEGAMLCLICPTATAAAVVTQKLGGDATDVTAYTVIINLVVAVVIPLLITLIYPGHSAGFIASFMLILGKVFPVLICPLLLAQFIRFVIPRVHHILCSYRNLAFYMWAVALSLAIAVTVKSIVHSTHPLSELIGVAVISLVCCVIQFTLGKKIGQRCGYQISTTQALGQKNTVFAIWLGYTFLNPVASMAGGFYSIWHNLYNTWQLRKTEAAGKAVK